MLPAIDNDLSRQSCRISSTVTVSHTVDDLLLNWWQWTAFGGSVVILVVLVVICVSVRRRAHRSRGTNPAFHSEGLESNCR